MTMEFAMGRCVYQLKKKKNRKQKAKKTKAEMALFI
jgi:hypothetical protein